MSELSHDIVTLAELQLELFQRETRQWLRAAIGPVVVLIASLVVLLGSVPVLLMAFAASLVEWTDLSQSAAYLIAAVTGIVLGGVAARIAMLRLSRNQERLERSKDEFNRNVRWIKQVLRYKANPVSSDCPPEPRSHR